MSKALNKPLATTIKAYKLRHLPYKPDTEYRHKLEGLMSELVALRKLPITLHFDAKYFRSYVYFMLNPLKPGRFRYVTPAGKVLTFNYEPFYVGKGLGNRMYDHVKDAKSGKGKTQKHYTIRKLLNAGVEPTIVKTKTNVSAFMALAFEIDCIAGIGRKDKKLGPLANLTDGGEGATGTVWTQAQRNAKSKASKGKKQKPRTPEQRAYLSKIRKGIPKPEWYKRMMSENMKGKNTQPRTEEAKANMRASWLLRKEKAALGLYEKEFLL